MDHIILIAQQIAKEGKTPNTALIKARAPKQTPLPSIIQGLKLWQSDPTKQISLPIESASADPITQQMKGNIEEIIERKIAQAIRPLKEEINILKATMTELKNNIEHTQQTAVEE